MHRSREARFGGRRAAFAHAPRVNSRRRCLLVIADVVAALALLAAVTVTATRLSRHDRPAPARMVAESPRRGDAALAQKDLPPLDDCRRRGISLRAGEGSCTLADGTSLTAVAPGREVRLDGLGLRVRGVQVLDRIGAGRAPLRPTPNGTFVRVELTLANRLDGIAQFRNEQIALALGATTVLGPNSFAADADPASLERRAAELQPGRAVEGAVTFDVPKTLEARFLRRFAGVRIVTFGENIVPHGRVGLLRLNR